MISENNLKYIKGINGLRAIAVILVVIYHWLQQCSLVNFFPIGRIGVDIFFVISGFLISKILFQEKNNDDLNFNRKVKIIKNFMIRRTVRIFPIYYILLIFLYITNGVEFRNNIIYYVTYTTNIFFYHTRAWYGMAAHFWSLAVEEQFYLFWPFLLIFINKKYTLKFIIFAIVVGTLYSFAINDDMGSNILTLSCINAFGIGALYSYLIIYRPIYTENVSKIIRILFFPMILLIILNYTILKIDYFPLRLIVSVITVNFIRICLEGKSKNIFYKIMNWKILNFIGILSYGIYLFHNPFTNYWRRLLLKMGMQNKIDNIYLEFMIKFSILILISYLSWIIIEKPFLKLKRYAK